MAETTSSVVSKAEEVHLDVQNKDGWWMGRVEIDTSAPFESVKQAVDLFSGRGQWKPHNHRVQQSHVDTEIHHLIEEDNIAVVEEQAEQLKKDLIVKEQETLDVLKELEMTKKILDDLKFKFQQESLEAIALSENTEAHRTKILNPERILMELKLNQPEFNQNSQTSDSPGCGLESKKVSLDKTHERQSINSAKISYLEKELDNIRVILQLPKNVGTDGNENHHDISEKLHELRQEMTEATGSEISKMASQIDEAKLHGENSNPVLRNSSIVTLPVEDYEFLTRKAQEAEDLSRKRIEAAMAQVDEAKKSKMELSKKVEEAKAEVEASRKALEEALERAETANNGKLAVEDALRKWRLERRGQKRRSICSSPKFKNSGHRRRRSRILDLNGSSLVTNESEDVQKPPTLSIGQILSRKLLGPEAFENRLQGNTNGEPEISLGQILGRRQRVLSPDNNGEEDAELKQFQTTKKKFGFVGLSHVLTKHSMKNKKKRNSSASNPK